MSEQPQAVLLDSNVYFRLACSIRPLLKGSFGDAPRYTMFVLAALDEEYRKNVRLQHKFRWVIESEYCNDRAAKLYELNRKRCEDVDRAVRFLAAYADGNYSGGFLSFGEERPTVEGSAKVFEDWQPLLA